tara:strand:- start:173 stop:451 length:279 start_codon:yes stop_codon:yes gene_type:complete
MSKTNLTSPCCNSEYEEDTLSYCCGAEISDSGLCYECRDHAEPEGYICDECEDYFGQPEAERFNCGACGEDLDEDTRYCSRECSVADNTEGV